MTPYSDVDDPLHPIEGIWRALAIAAMIWVMVGCLFFLAFCGKQERELPPRDKFHNEYLTIKGVICTNCHSAESLP